MPGNTPTPKPPKPLWWDKLRLLRKRFWRKSYSQHGEDLILAALFEGVQSGFYVDVGSFHPRKYSNTRRLFEDGWRGINIDISGRKKALFDFDRPDDHNIACAVTDRSGELAAYVFGNQSALDTTDKATADAWAQRFNMPYTATRVPGRTLTDILESCGSPRVDYLNIDVEGAELAVLKGLDFGRFKPRCLSIEIHGNLEEAAASDVYALLSAQGYHLHAWTPPTFFFVLSDGK